MATIDKEQDVLTLINVFTVAPERQDELAALLADATERTMKRLPGFVSASIHKSHDGTRVVNYAQWRSQDDFNAMQRDEGARVHMRAAAALARFDPILCQVTDSVAAEGVLTSSA
jgi:heme-degrading monooxygenase HmoA